ncbi:hypothetical protein F441_03281 [Phytophthora nicotianae CJ01A1]|uniref:Uncharacterized protein n=2 Tax=Phytophthora nicotianae TaxID=4792 RepID=W2XL49_PHYNI|nr:hypothetical protein L914_03143 [Phytophthora nicotianae]ETP23625.1 hypothetical protein F441_03281 [Phytophthora nicotianae CJ01A1]
MTPGWRKHLNTVVGSGKDTLTALGHFQTQQIRDISWWWLFNSDLPRGSSKISGNVVDPRASDN